MVLICAVNVRMNLVGLHPVPTWDGLYVIAKLSAMYLSIYCFLSSTFQA